VRTNFSFVGLPRRKSGNDSIVFAVPRCQATSRNSRNVSPAGRARYCHSFDHGQRDETRIFESAKGSNSYVTSGICSRTNRHWLGPEAAALPSPAVRLAASASIHSINSFGINLTMCCPLFCGRLSRSPARNKIISSSRVSSVLVLYIGSSCPVVLRRRFAWLGLSRHHQR
jgi:hypothetical protein